MDYLLKPGSIKHNHELIFIFYINQQTKGYLSELLLVKKSSQ